MTNVATYLRVVRKNEQERKDDNGYHQVHEGASAKHDSPFEYTLSGEAAWIGRVFLAHHPDEAAQWYPVNGVNSFAVANPEYTRREPESELGYLYAEALGGQEVA